MIKKRRLFNIFPGWWIVMAGSLLALWGHGYYFSGFSALFKPISGELHFSRAVTSVAGSIGRFEGGFEAPLAGWLTDKFGPRWVIMSGILLAGIGLIMMYFINSVWAFYLAWGILIGTGVNIALTVPLDTAIANWFVKKRGLAVSIKYVFIGLAGVITLPIIAWLIATQGWRATCAIGGLVFIVIGVPLVWLFIRRHRPEYYGLLPDGAVAKAEAAGADKMIDSGVKYAAEVKEIEFTLRQAMRTSTYWLLVIAYTAWSVAGAGITMHLIPFLTDTGIGPIQAAGMVTVMYATSIPGRFGGGFLADFVSHNRLRFLMALTFLLQGAGFAILLLNPSLVAVYLWLVLYGLGHGAFISLIVPVRARCFGRKALGSVTGSATLFQSPIGAAAPIYIGWVYDTTGSYTTAFIVITIVMVLGMVLALFILPPKPPPQVTDVRKIL
ncbi:MAG: MFS transporter [Chloroflexota bacterium]